MNEKGLICVLLRDLLVFSLSRALAHSPSVRCCLFMKFSPAKCACESVSTSCACPGLSLSFSLIISISLCLCVHLCAHRSFVGCSLASLSLPEPVSLPALLGSVVSLCLCVSVSLSLSVSGGPRVSCSLQLSLHLGPCRLCSLPPPPTLLRWNLSRTERGM